MSGRRRPKIGLGIFVFLCFLFFLLPFWSAARFGFSKPRGGGYTFQSVRDLIHGPDFGTTLWLSFRLAVGTTVLSLLLVVPTLAWLHLKVSKLLPAAELVSVLPYVVPAIALVSGASKAFHSAWPFILIEPIGLIPLYVIVALPFTYRSIDNGIRAVDLKTLTEASRGLGASWTKTLTAVIVPNIITSLLGAAFLTMAVVLGEYTISSLLLHKTFPVYLALQNQEDPRGATAMGLMSILATWMLLGGVSLLGRRRKGGGGVTVSAFQR